MITSAFDADPQAAAANAERLLFTNYRCWMAGYSTRDISCWEIAWNALAGTLGVDAARPLYGEFHCFVRTILETARRDIGWRPTGCRCPCRDEALVLALVQASQRGQFDNETTTARDLLGHDDCRALVASSRSLGRALSALDLRLGLDHADAPGASSPPRLLH
ncbi:hypothetical protein LGH83_06375 [Lichenihabitans sp. PAMC28606]|uniref:hypothetical protein n=1 Tax=Lichenihabitans sp. PAMC28606 TaxID=2880932 RepID=UPI001D0A1032|nr:hypothetical protein [Lichenihabitans sp. PAMC28606]UDL95824.1 hypothetical protein LGH83_06375 [Lichenihabitans sp. PAMC28606]